MSSREPLWFCHECHAEMRPLMVPDPVCASCHGSFVEKMENGADDPREFAHEGTELEGDRQGTPPPPLDAIFFTTLQSLMDRGMGSGLGPRSPTRRATTTGPSVTFEVRGTNGSRSVRLGGPNSPDGESGFHQPTPPGTVPNMSSFVGPPFFGVPPPGQGGPGGNISGTLMAQYLMALLGHRDPALFGMPENGRMGDYVFNQEALDQIISQIMETTNAHRPVAATDDIINKLPQDLLMEGSALLEQDCAVCKEQFMLNTEDPDEQIVVTLPCKHPFHKPCILPWLSSSGTCPVCRYALVPQPDQYPTTNRNSGPDSGGGRSRPAPPSSPNDRSPRQPPSPGADPDSGTGSSTRGGSGGGGGAGIFQGIINGISGMAHHGRPSSHTRQHSLTSTASGTRSPTSESRSRPTPRRSSSNSTWHSPPPSPSTTNFGSTSNRRRNANNGHRNLPGGWADELD